MNSSAERDGDRDGRPASLGIAATVWWSFSWRLLAAGLPLIVIASWLIASTVGFAPVLSNFVGLSIWVPLSVVALKLALGKHIGMLPSWTTTLGCWWSMVWRATAYAVAIGLVMGVLVSVFIGRPREHPGGLIVGWLLAIGPGEILAFRAMLIRRNLKIAYVER